jgi:hypothetical protein
MLLDAYGEYAIFESYMKHRKCSQAHCYSPTRSGHKVHRSVLLVAES